MNDQLKHALKQEDTILFVGSGISCWAGLPSWSGLLLQLADYLEACGGDAEIVRRELKPDLLQKEQSNAFLDTVSDTDFTLALNAVKYLKTGHKEVVTRLLKEIPQRAELYSNMDHRIPYSVEYGVQVSLPIRSCHEQSLREILKLGGIIRAAAAGRLIELQGHTAAETFITDRLAPLLGTQDSVLQENLVRVLEHAGLRHGRRYVAR